MAAIPRMTPKAIPAFAPPDMPSEAEDVPEGSGDDVADDPKRTGVGLEAASGLDVVATGGGTVAAG